MKKQIPALLAFSIFTLIAFSCSDDGKENVISRFTKKVSTKPYRWVGDIKADSLIDSPDFKPCFGDGNIKQYFNIASSLEYEGERPALYREFENGYKPVQSDKSGWIRVRFIVNCKGETGRFRLLSANEDYEEIEFEKAITDQLLAISKSLNGWKLQPDSDNPQDYYQYLTFKMKKGEIIEILP